MLTSKELSIVIVNYRSEQYLKNCVASLYNNLGNASLEIIVVNNDEKEQLEQIKKSFPEIILIDHKKNIGFSAACNLGAKSAKGEILCFLNPDTEIISENITELIQQFDDTNIGVVGPRLVDEKNNTQEWIAGKEITILSTLLNNLGYKRDRKIWESSEKVECAWVSGAAMFIKKDIFQKLGGFDEKFFMYFEDVDLCKRARGFGCKILYYPEFVIKHFGGHSFLDKKEQKRYYYTSQLRYFLKNCRLRR